jgi:hypothetical protein
MEFQESIKMKVPRIQPVQRVPFKMPEREEKRLADNFTSGQSSSITPFEIYLDIARREQYASEKPSTQKQ